jgi:regulator of protease activity HflC (stomatin/prohibitin superfamily)
VPYIRSFTVLLKELGLLYKNGELIGELQAGVHYFWKNTVDTQVLRTETRQQQLEIAGQEILTKDKANLRINFYAQYVVTDIRKALDENKEYQKQLYILIQLALREFIGTLTFDELLEKKQPVSAFIMETLQPKLVCLGVELNDCGIRDIILPGEMKEIMNQVLIAEKQAQAHTITRIDETASVRSMLNTAKLMEENEMLFKLKEMEYVDKIADKINSISLSGGNQVLDQLRDIFSVKK